MTVPPIVLDSLDLCAAERRLVASALTQAGSLVAAARLLGITRHALKRRIAKHRIDWDRGVAPGELPSAP
jgi:transcriptional regulator with GAF, ATPase, and Fis domain